jgi:membrane protein
MLPLKAPQRLLGRWSARAAGRSEEREAPPGLDLDVRGAGRALWLMTKAVFRSFYNHHALDHGATMSFYFFLGLLPLLVIAGLVVEVLVKAQGIESLSHSLTLLMPSGVAALVQDELRDMVSEQGRSVAPLSLIGFLVLTTNGIHNLMDVFEVVFGAPPRPWWRQRLIALLWLLVTLLGVSAVLSFAVLLNRTLHAEFGQDLSLLLRIVHRAQSIAASTWELVGALALFLVVSAGALASFYRISVHRPRRVKRRVIPGALVAVACWVLVSWAFGQWVTRIAHYAVYYGGLAAVAVFLLWLYLTSLAILLGAEVNSYLEGERELPPAGRASVP